ncbi:MAG TPA: iron ABC transporter permease [Euryarchaeota archaeon]|nr:hemin transport system permease protein HmuU [archaeon BMS3Bbin15]HDL16025.1 iron ABC transporter permease [Euryarchaeota archaeon]
MRYKFLFLFLLAIAALVFCLEVVIGPVKISLTEIIKVLLGNSTGKYDIIIKELRLPRAVLAFTVGFSLSTAGAVYQGIFKNPMADPYVLGVASGAALGMSIGLVYFQSYYLILAFIAALITLFLVYSIASHAKGGLPTNTLLLSGIAISLLFSSLTALILYLNSKSAAMILFTLMGTISNANWSQVKISLSIFPIFFLIYIFSKELNILTLGEENAKVMGVDAEKFKKILLVLSTLITSISVALCGIIGFVGLITPHMARLMVGQNFRYLLPVSAVLGAILILIADILARTMISQAEIPINIITTLFGVPFFLYLLTKGGKKQ